MRTPQTELEMLRVSLARVAQAVGGLCLSNGDPEGGVPLDGKAYEQLLRLAQNPDGWNRLCASIIEEVKCLKREHRELVAASYGCIGYMEDDDFVEVDTIPSSL